VDYGAFAHNKPAEGAGFAVLVQNNTVMIIDYDGVNKELAIPALINGMPVRSIGADAFGGKGIISVTIPEGVVYIGDGAFGGNNLKSVVLPEGLTTLGREAFVSNELTSVSLPKSLVSVGVAAFRWNKLYNVMLPDETVLDAFVFADNDPPEGGGFSIAVQHNEVMIIGNDRTRDNPVIPALISGMPVTAIGDGAFSHRNLKSCLISEGVRSIGKSAFAGNFLRDITFPESVAYIGGSAFQLNNISEVIIPAGVALVDSAAFKDNPLKSITIYGSAIRIGARAFGERFDVFYESNGKKPGHYTHYGLEGKYEEL
jgi:hypothetical protein